jgi:hypothetical protein
MDDYKGFSIKVVRVLGVNKGMIISFIQFRDKEYFIFIIKLKFILNKINFSFNNFLVIHKDF